MKKTPLTADEHVIEQLDHYSKKGNFALGLIIGQCTHQRNFLIHLAPTFKTKTGDNGFNLSTDELRVVKEHAKFISHLLPGGLWILGVYVISERKSFTIYYISHLFQILRDLDQPTIEGFDNYGKYPSDSYLFFHKNPTTKNLSCSSVDKTNVLHPVDCQFQNTTSPWYHIDSDFNLKGTFLDRSHDIPFQQQIADFLSQVTEKVNELNIIIFGKEWEPSNYLEQILKNKCKGNAIDVTLYQTPKKIGSSKVHIGDTAAQLQAVGSVRSRVSLHPRTTVEEAAAAIRQDIIRSLTTKLQLHWESLVGEENRAIQEGERVHEPPRRVLINPKGWNVFLCDYLFPGERINQTVRSCFDIFDLIVDEEDIVDNFEIPAGDGVLGDDVYDETGNSLSKIPTSYTIVGVAFLILCIALIINFVWN